MKLTKQLSILATGLLFVSTANAQIIADTYWGADRHSYTDVIGTASYFDISQMEVLQSGTSLTVNIYTNLVDNLGKYPGLTHDGNGIGFGDLFLSNGWNPDTSGSNYENDDNASGQLWHYGVSIDNNDRWSKGGGSLSLYQLNGSSNADNTILTQELMSGGIFRNGQEVSVDTNAQIAPTLISSGSWSVNDAQNILSFDFDISGTSLVSASEIGLHWAMTCGNDTIEGSVAVPEPSALALMGISILGLGFISRRRKAANI